MLLFYALFINQDAISRHAPLQVRRKIPNIMSKKAAENHKHAAGHHEKAAHHAHTAAAHMDHATEHGRPARATPKSTAANKPPPFTQLPKSPVYPDKNRAFR